ncbi:MULTISPECIES: hypothetical protein [unclassified Treponema]|uniref:hypothetical protein n=1 Tax=unclassified Treponema TaxID=2638727 RepID=UPI0020A33CF7|nr:MULTISPECIES: hypothetical protein [unclassified Treponema]UTC68011.1 hypothetical protein E4O06_05040 [Treponema sp. OMZ 789]UTC70733.1 hypothetical protein E4O01_05185 [Treponema sp. OMZ 790]UTC73453.1 hypothetical protein E4O02_05275 [Treponema sp. OMZ 791]
MSRKIYKILSLILIFFIMFSCKTTPKNDPNFIGDFDSFDLGSVMAGVVTRIKGEIKPTEFKFTFFPRSNIVSIKHKFMVDTVSIFLDQSDREILIKAMETYIDAYKNHSLTKADSDKDAFFAKTRILMAWGLFGGSSHRAEPVLRAQYQLLSENRPYFILANATTRAIGEKDDSNCPALRLALSPAQCEDFIMLLKQETLVQAVENIKKDFERFEPANNQNGNTEASEKNDTVNYDGF